MANYIEQRQSNFVENSPSPAPSAGNMFDIYGTNMFDTYNTSTPTPSPTTTPIKQTGLNSAQQEIAGGVVGGVAQVGAVAVGGAMQMADNEKARDEARQMAQLQRSDTLQQSGVEYSIRAKSQEQEEKAFKLQKKIEQYDYSYSRWESLIKKTVEDKQRYVQLTEKIFSKVDTDPRMQNIFSNLFGA